MTSLVTATGMSMGALYRYFASKEDASRPWQKAGTALVNGEFVTAEPPDELLAWTAHDLREAGWTVSENTVAARMVELGLAGRLAKRRRSLTRQGKRPVARDLVRRIFTAVAPDVLWCGDVTQIDTDEGPLYLAATEDLFSRRMLGYAMSEHHDATLVWRRCGWPPRPGAVRWTESSFTATAARKYPAAATTTACQVVGVVQSMGRVGSALDTAAAEAFNSTLKVEFVHRHRFATRAEARIRVATWIADFYNTTRRHSANDGLPPIPFERRMAQARAVSMAQVRAEVA